MTENHYGNLSRALNDRHSPLVLYLRDRFGYVKDLVADYRQRAGPLLVHPGGVPPTTLGTAFELMLDLRVDPAAAIPQAIKVFAVDFGLGVEIGYVLDVAHEAAASPGRSEDLARACWALALSVEVYRMAGIHPGSPLDVLVQSGSLGAEELLAVAAPEAVAEMCELEKVAEANFFPRLSAPVDLNPVLTGARLCPAEPDMIAGGVLIDVKTRIGKLNNKTGERTDEMLRRDLEQLVSYVLFDRDNTHQLTAIGTYSARS